MDIANAVRDTAWMRPGAGAARSELAHTLGTAYSDGLLSERTLAHRLDLLFSARLVEPLRLVGDLTGRRPRRRWSSAARHALATALYAFRSETGLAAGEPPTLLALDWSGAQEELLVGRHPSCDVVLRSPYVSRRHARLAFRDGNWIVHDLHSRNGTRLNGVSVGRSGLRPGDELTIGAHRLKVD